MCTSTHQEKKTKTSTNLGNSDVYGVISIVKIMSVVLPNMCGVISICNSNVYGVASMSNNVYGVTHIGNNVYSVTNFL